MINSSAPDRMVMMCADDDPQLLETLEFMLAKNFPEHRIIACVSGQDAIEQLQECKSNGLEVQLIISDQVMDDLTGIEVLSRSPDMFPGAIRIIMTGQAGLQSAVDAIKLGVDDYIDKEFTERNLVKTIRNHLNTYHLRQDNRRLQEFVKHVYLRTSEITDLAFRTFNYHLTRLLNNQGDRREVIEALRKARDNINLLSRLYKLNHTMAREEAFEPISPETLVRAALKHVQGVNGDGMLPRRRQQVLLRTFDSDQEIYGNADVLRIVLERILENACKFSPEEARIELTIHGPRSLVSGTQTAATLPPDLLELLHRGYTIVSIKDESTPGPEDFQSLLYVQEWQQPTQDDVPTLKGLGLVIAQEYLLLLGGHLLIDAKVGHKGATVHVAFPNDARGTHPGRSDWVPSS